MSLQIERIRAIVHLDNIHLLALSSVDVPVPTFDEVRDTIRTLKVRKTPGDDA